MKNEIIIAKILRIFFIYTLVFDWFQLTEKVLAKCGLDLTESSIQTERADAFSDC